MSTAYQPEEDDAAPERLQLAEDAREGERARRMAEAMGLEDGIVMTDHFEYIPLTEEEIYRNAGMGDLWDRAEAGEALPALVRERIRIAGAKISEVLKPEIERIWSEGSGADPLGLASLVDR